MGGRRGEKKGSKGERVGNREEEKEIKILSFSCELNNTLDIQNI